MGDSVPQWNNAQICLELQEIFMTNAIPLLSTEEQVARLLATPRPGAENILAYYEHRMGGIGKDPRLMLLPLDDHLAHRGDGVFETIKYIGGRLYQLDEHMQRMRRSADSIFLAPPCSWEHIQELCLTVARHSEEQQGTLRVLLGRGPGGFGIAPSECPESSLYIIASRFTPPTEAWYNAGLKGFRTSIPAKQSYLARIKNTNYLPNVLMMHEAKERGMDVPFCFDAEGFLAESAVANICLVNNEGVVEVPRFTNSLPGTTLLRAMTLLEGKREWVHRSISEADIKRAAEVLMLGTGPECVAVVSYEGTPIGNGTPGETSRLMRGLIHTDMLENGVPFAQGAA